MTSSDRPPPRPRNSGAWLALVVAVGLLARLAVLSRCLGPTGLVLDDPDNYLPLARSVASGEGLALDGRPTAYRPPLYPLILAPLAGTLGNDVAWGVAALHLILGMATVLATFQTARRWGLSEVRCLVAAGVVALDPVLVAQGRSVMTETLAAALCALTLLAVTAPGLRGAALGGVAFGLSALCRPTAWPVLGLSAVAAFGLPPGDRQARIGRAGLLLAFAAATAAPWAWRNAVVFGEPVWTTTHGGYTLALANNPVYYDEVVNGPPGAVWTGGNQWRWWDSVNQAARGLPEPEADRLARAMALRTIADRPADFARATVARLGRFWGFAPSGEVYPRPLRLATALWTAPLWGALMVGLTWRGLRAWPRAVALLAILGLTAVHAVYWTDMRMRAAAVPAIALIVAAAAAETGAPAALKTPRKK